MKLKSRQVKSKMETTDISLEYKHTKELMLQHYINCHAKPLSNIIGCNLFFLFLITNIKLKLVNVNDVHKC